MRGFRKKYTKNFHKIRKQKIMKSRKRSGGGFFSSLGLLGRAKTAPIAQKEVIRAIDTIDDVEEDIQGLKAKQEEAERAAQEEAERAAQREAQEKAQQKAEQEAQEEEERAAQKKAERAAQREAAQQEAQKETHEEETQVKKEGITKAIPVLEGLREKVSRNMSKGNPYFYRTKTSLELLTRLSVHKKRAGIEHMNDIIKTYSKLIQEDQEELLKKLNSAIEKKKELLIKYEVSCNTSHPPPKSNYLTRILNNIPYMSDTRNDKIKALYKENTNLNGCLKSHDLTLTPEEKESVAHLNNIQRDIKVELYGNIYILETFKEDLSILKQIQEVYDGITVSPSSYSSSSSSSYQKDRLTGENFVPDYGFDGIYAGGSKKRRISKRHTKRHKQNNKKRYTKKTKQAH